MKKEIIETGKTVDEAIESACEKLGCDRDACEWEIVDLPKKGFLGLKNLPAKVKVSFGEDEPEPVRPATPVHAEKPSAPLRQEAAITATKPQDKPAAAAPAPAPAEKPAAQPEPTGKPIELVGDLLTKAETAKSYLQAVLAEMKLTPELVIVPEETGICIRVKGEGLGAIIGRRGETLDSLQYLSGLVANRLDGDYLRVTVDCGDYRLKRKATLEALAQKLSGQVLKTNVSKTLEPMNPFERRIIHSTVSTIEGVSSTSIGEEPNRRVVITSPTARPARSSGGRGRPGGGGGRDRDFRGGSGRSGGRGGSGGGYNRQGGGYNRQDGGNRRPSGPRRDSRPHSGGSSSYQPKPPANPPAEAKGIDKPLYSKLDLE